MKANKKFSIAAIVLGVCALSCAASGAVAFAATEVAPTPTTVLTMKEGASIRNFTPMGIRFTSELSTTKYNELSGQGYTFGTLIVPASYVPAGGITLENYNTINAVTVQAQNSIAVDEVAGKVTFSGTLVGTADGEGNFTNFPSDFYNVSLTAVSYYANAEGAIVEFASNPQTYSIAYIASALQAEGQTDPYYTTITDAVLADGISFGAISYDLKAGATLDTTLNSQGLKAVYSSKNDNVVTVDEDGKLKGVGDGTTTVTATIGGKTATAEVNVSSIFRNNPTYSDGSRTYVESVDESDNVSVTPVRSGYMERDAMFNIEAGTLYYAEATFSDIKKDSSGNYPMFGLAHFNTLSETVADGDAYHNAGSLLNRKGVAAMKSGSSKTFRVGNLTSGDEHWYDGSAAYSNANFKENTFTSMTIAIARSGGTIYTFVDGQLLQCADLDWGYVSGALNTTPGIIACSNENAFTVNNIIVLSGTEAQTKLAELTASKSVFGNNPDYASNNVKTYQEYLGEDGTVNIQTGRYGELAATFNMKASKLYYAEATFSYIGTSYPTVGLAHFAALNEVVDESVTDSLNGGGRFGRRCIENVLSGNGKFLVRDLKTTEQHWYDNYTWDNIYLHSSFKANSDITTMTIAIARSGNTIYTFVDGKLINESDVPADYSGATTPGIITCGGNYTFKFSGVNMCSGEEAQAKIKKTMATASIFGINPAYSEGSVAYRQYLGEDGGVKITNSRNGEIAATFNMEASTLYYAEATFGVVDTSNSGNYPAFGLAHYLALNEIVDQSYADTYDGGPRYGRVCVASIKSGSSQTFLIGNLKANHYRWYSADALYKDGNFQANDFTQMTVAIARTADTLYTFVNGKLVQAVPAPDNYKNVATTPGIITICEAGKVTISGVNMLSGAEAQAKINTLTATNA